MEEQQKNEPRVWCIWEKGNPTIILCTLVPQHRPRVWVEILLCHHTRSWSQKYGTFLSLVYVYICASFVREHYSHFAKQEATLRVKFEHSDITLDISLDGLVTREGWRMTPLTAPWQMMQWRPSCMFVMDGDGVADEKLWHWEVWWTNLAAIGGGSGPPCRWSKHDACKENSQEAQGWRYV